MSEEPHDAWIGDAIVLKSNVGKDMSPEGKASVLLARILLDASKPELLRSHLEALAHLMEREGADMGAQYRDTYQKLLDKHKTR